MSFSEEEGEEGVDKEEGEGSNEESEESDKDPYEHATLKHIQAEVAAPSSSSFRRLFGCSQGETSS